MIVRPWQPGDNERLVLQEAQEILRADLTKMDFAHLSEQGLAWVGETDEGIMAIAGVAPQWENRATAWAFVSVEAGQHFRQIHRAVNQFLIDCPFRRVDATVDVGFKPGHRWMKMLGFEPEGYLKAYRPDGGDQVLYARVRR